MKLRLTLLSIAAAAVHGQAIAHDTWFERQGSQAEGLRLLLGTGTQFPSFETGIDERYLATQGCRRAGAGDAAVAPMKPAGQAQAALILHAPADASSCWAQLLPLQIELPAAKIETYLHEIQASAELRATWAEMAGRGLPWVERYTKHARVELGGAAPAPAAMSMDMVVEGSTLLRVGDTVRVQVLRDGQPLPAFAVEWRVDASRLGIWRRTDADGRVELTLPIAGQWLLRGVDLRRSETERDAWESRFVTLSLQVLPPALPRAVGGSVSNR